MNINTAPWHLIIGVLLIVAGVTAAIGAFIAATRNNHRR